MSRARRAFDLLESRLEPLAARRPGLALAGADLLGRLRNRLSRSWPSPEQVRDLFPHLGISRAKRISWRIGGLEARNRLLINLVRRGGLDPVRRLVRTPESFASLRPPLILGTFHVGAINAIGPALEDLPGPVLILRQSVMYQPRPPVLLEITHGDEQRRAAAFHRALAHLGDGGFVVMALDLQPERGGPRAPCLGKTLELARGPLALARITGAPLAPLVGRWRRGRVEVVAGERLEGETEDELARSAALWLERYLLDSPAETGLGLIRSLLNAD